MTNDFFWKKSKIENTTSNDKSGRAAESPALAELSFPTSPKNGLQPVSKDQREGSVSFPKTPLVSVFISSRFPFSRLYWHTGNENIFSPLDFEPASTHGPLREIGDMTHGDIHRLSPYESFPTLRHPSSGRRVIR